MEKRKHRSHAQRRRDNAAAGRRDMSADEERAFETALEIIKRLPEFVCERRLALDAMEVLAAAKYRTESRRRSDKRTDGQRRKLVGARLRMEDAAEVEMWARVQGVSVYRFVVDALAAACRRARKKYGDRDAVEVVRQRGRPCVCLALPSRQNSYAIE